MVDAALASAARPEAAVRVRCPYCQRDVLLAAGGWLTTHHGTVAGRQCRGTGYQYVDLEEIPDNELTIEQRQRLRELRR